MLILHGTWLADSASPREGSFALWAEDLQAFVEHRSVPETAKACLTAGSLHPYAADPARIEEAVASLIAPGANESSSVSAGSLVSTALLPVCDSGSLLPSYELERTLEAMALSNPEIRSLVSQDSRSNGQGGARLLRFLVPAYEVPPSSVVSILAPALKGLRSLSGEVAIADDFTFFAELLRYELSLLSRGKLTPVLEPHAGSGGGWFRSQWRLLVNEDDDIERYRLLVRSVPPVCRAFTRLDAVDDANPGDATSSVHALGRSDVVQGFLGVTSDALVRTWLCDAAIEIECGGAEGLWLKALSDRTTPGNYLEGGSSSLARLCIQTMEWAEAVSHSEPTSRFQTCFRLEPPEDLDQDPSQGLSQDLDQDPSQDLSQDLDRENRTWTLRFFIVDERDRSLLVPASRVWREGGGTLKFLNRRYERPRETFATDLWRAGTAFVPIKGALRRSMVPEYCDLSPEEAYRFLKEAAPVLERIGFVVLLPAIEQHHRRPEVRLRIRPSGQEAEGFFSLHDLLEYNWRIALGDTIIDVEEFQRMVDLKTPLVNVRGKWVELSAEHIAQVTGLLEDLGKGGTVTASRAICLSLAGGKEGYESLIDGVDVEGGLKDLLELIVKPASYESLETPKGFRGQLRPYQVRGFSWLHFLTKHGLGACLADDMGLGKTIQLLALALHYRETVSARKRKPILIVCPASVVYNWQRETERFAPALKVMVHHGSDRLSGRKLHKEAKRHDLVITTYALASRDTRTLTGIEWSGVVLDEAQNIKNPATKQAKNIKKLKAEYRVALTGTPVENRLTELWSIIDFLNPGYLGSLRGFRSDYATPIERRGSVKRAELLRRVIRPFVLRRLKTDPAVIRDLPEKEEIKAYCNLTPEQATLYEAFVQNTLRRVDDATGMERRGQILAMLTGLKQICNHPAHFLRDESDLDGRSGKLTRLSEMLDELVSEGDSALVFTQFVEMGELLKQSLEETLDREVMFLHGGVPARKRAEMVERFQSPDNGPTVFVLSLRAGGTGLNLTSASRVFHYDRWWNPAVENQATDRAFRIGQTQNVQVYKFICRGTLEERIDALIDEKKALSETVVGSGEDWVTELSTDELQRLIALDPEAIVNE